MAQPVMQVMGSLNPIDAVLATFNTNPYFIGLMMLFLNLGGRFLMMEVSKEQEKFFQNPWIRRLLIFTVLFVATRNVLVAFVLTLFVILAIGYLFNENSALCIYNGGKSGSKCGSNDEKGPAMTIEEQEILRRLSEKHMRLNSKQEEKKEGNENDIDDSEIYLANMSLIRN
jgi:hypothetical protein